VAQGIDSQQKSVNLHYIIVKINTLVNKLNDPSTHKLKHWSGILASVIPQLYLVWVLIDVWRFPMQWDDGLWVSFGVKLIVLEFFLLHSGVFMGVFALAADTTGKRLKYFFFLLMFYSIFIVSFFIFTGSLTVTWIFGSVMLGRVYSLIVAVQEAAPNLIHRSFGGGMLYVFLTPASIFLPIPELGINNAVTHIAFPEGDGVWTRQPERGLAMAIAYFTIMALLELFYFGKQK